MVQLWLLKGKPDAQGWGDLQLDSMSNKINVLHFDRDAWAMVKTEQKPTEYIGLEPTRPPDGLYLDNFGRPCYVLDQKEVHSARKVVNALGKDAEALFQKVGDADRVLERLGRVY